MPRFVPLAIAAAATLAACEDGVSRPRTPSADTAIQIATGQTWLCGREYVNHAWGYQRRGAVIDTAGKVWTYDFKGSPTALVNPWTPKDMRNMSEEELKLRYNGATASERKVPIDEIESHLPLIAEAAKATPTERKNVGADMGAYTLYCLLYNRETRAYAEVMLDQKGDWESTNPSDTARTLAAWVANHVGPVK